MFSLKVRLVMVESAQGPGYVGLVFPLFLSLLMGIVAHLLAKEKGRNVILWTILGCIPVFNFAAMWFFVGASNLKLEKKLDEIIERQRRITND
jgi:hypothetical protein